MPSREQFDALHDWLEREATEHDEFRTRMRRIVRGLLVAVLVMGAAITVGLFQLSHEVTRNRIVLRAVCRSQAHTIKQGKDSLKTSPALFGKLLPADQFHAALVKFAGQIRQEERDLRSLHCRELNRGL